MKIVTGGQMRAIEAVCIEKTGVPSVVLMENAAISAAEYCAGRLSGLAEPRVAVVAGPGNNGGDGLAAARQLRVSGARVDVIFVGGAAKASGDCLTNLNIVKNMGIPITEVTEEALAGEGARAVAGALRHAHLTVDSLLGTGASRELEGAYARIVELINACAGYVVSVDIPSGVDADTGRVLGAAVRADATVTFGFGKLGLYLHPGAEYAGEVVRRGISIPEELAGQAGVGTFILDGGEAAKLLPARKARSNKGTYGNTYVFAGCAEMPGAAAICCGAAYRAGAGLVTACVVKDVADVVHARSMETITRILPDDGGYLCGRSADMIAGELKKAACAAVGPGLGRAASSAEFLSRLLENVSCPLVIDADGLNILSENPALFGKIKTPCVITPHPGEMARLMNRDVETVMGDTLGAARNFARRYGVVTVLKDARTIVASPAGEAYINTTGTPALAKAGSGDALTGVIGGLISQGLDCFTAAVLGAYIHGRAGELAARELSVYGVNAGDCVNYIPAAMSHLSSGLLSPVKKATSP